MNATDLNEVVENRIRQKLAKGMTNVQAATNRLMQEGKMSKDFIFAVGTERKGKDPSIIFHPDDSGKKVQSTFIFPKTGPEQFTVHPHALRQVSEKLRIPTTYLTSLLFGEEWQRELGYEIMNATNGWTDRNKVLVRAVGTEVRAFLSDSYRVLDSEMIFGAHMEAVFSNNAQLSDGLMTDTQLMMESLLPTPITIETPYNGTIMVAFGMRLQTSDYGAGKLSAKSFLLQGICLNGAVFESVLKEVHLGAKLQGIDNILSRETIMLDSKANASAVRDITRHLYSHDVIKDKMLRIEATANEKVDSGNILKGLRDVGKLLKGEADNIGEILLRNDPNSGVQGESTLWKMTQAITALANDEEKISVERRLELQELAGELFKKAN
jgi:hypothetical protein